MKQLEADIVVVSTGTAGLPAAITAAQSKANVIAFEKQNFTGGTGNMANGLFGVETRVQRIKEYTLTKEAAFKIYMDFCHWRVNARLIKTLIDRSADTFDWLESLGVEFEALMVSHGFGNYYTWHLVKVPPDVSDEHRRGSTMMRILTEKARELGVQIYLKTPVKNLIKENGKIVGVMAQDASGEEIQARAKAVILATGGIGDGMLQGMFSNGEGIRMAKEAGAAVKEVERKLPRRPPGGGAGGPPGMSGSPDKPPAAGTNAGMQSSVNICFQQGGLMVNLLGERFMNEEITVNTNFGASAISLQKDGCAITIFDEDAKNHYVEYLDHVPGVVGAKASFTQASNFNTEITEILERGPGNIFVANSVEELAEKVGVDANTFKATIDEYNIACDTGRDKLFNKNPKWLRPVRQPPFYANKGGGMGDTEWGGIKINHKFEVMTEDFAVIPGLYAVGMEAACNYYYDLYPNVLPATAMGFSAISGHLAGENALQFIK